MRARRPLVPVAAPSFASFASFAVAALVAPACTFDAQVPAGAALSCASSADCPTGRRCSGPPLSRCVADDADLVPPALASSTVAPGVVAAGDGVDATFAVDRDLALAPAVTLLAPAGARAVVATPGDARAFAAHFDVTAADGEGNGEIVADVVGVNGVAARLSLGVVRIDLTAPNVVGNAAFTITPPPSSPIADVRALGPGAVATVVFVVDEALARDPVVDLAGVAGVTQALEQNGAAYTLTLTVGAAATEGPLAIDVTLADAVENTRTVALPFATPLVVDVTADAAPASLVDGIRFTRRPWGSPFDGHPAPSSGVDIPAAAALDGRILLFVDDTGAEIGRASLAATPVSVSFTRFDAAAVASALVDDAGNIEDPPQPVRHETFVSSLIGKVVGDDLVNPNRLIASAPADAGPPGVIAAPLGRAEIGGAAGLVDGDIARSDGALAWSLSPGAPTLFRVESGIAYVPLVDGLLSQGGFTTTSATTFVLGSNGWFEEPIVDDGADGAPGVVTAACLGYDETRSRAVMFGDTLQFWELAGRDWINATPPGLTGNRGDCGMVWDRANRRLLVLDADGALSSWDGATRAVVAPPDQRVVVNLATPIVYDEALDQTVFFAQELDGIHALVLVADRWVERAPDSGKLLVLDGDYSVAFDASLGAVVLHGSVVPNDVQSLVTWDGDAYDSITVDNPLPADRGAHIAYDNARDRLVYVSGISALGTYFFDAGVWRRITDNGATVFAGDVFGSEMTAGARRTLARVSVIAGALGTQTWVADSDDGVFVPGVFPGEPSDTTLTEGAAAIYDPTLDRTLLFGSNGATVNAFDGATWGKITGPAGPLLVSSRLSYDDAGTRVVAFDGAATTWAWDDAFGWRVVADDTAGDGDPSAVGPMAFDPDRGHLLMFAPAAGGASAVWSLVGDDWRPAATSDVEGDGEPAPRGTSGALVHCAQLGGMLLVGGVAVSGGDVDSAAELWLLSSSSWRALRVVSREGTPLAGTLGAVDTAAGLRVVSNDGFGHNTSFLLTTGGSAQTFAAALSPARIPSDVPLDAVSVSWSAAGSGDITLDEWDGRAFTPLTAGTGLLTSAATPSAPLGPGGVLLFRAHAAGNDAGVHVDTDAVEVRVDFTLP